MLSIVFFLLAAILNELILVTSLGCSIFSSTSCCSSSYSPSSSDSSCSNCSLLESSSLESISAMTPSSSRPIVLNRLRSGLVGDSDGMLSIVIVLRLSRSFRTNWDSLLDSASCFSKILDSSSLSVNCCSLRDSNGRSSAGMSMLK